jgi:short subunit dehydrogenase-like uncharacterized protein
MAEKTYDLTIFGATGFTGKNILDEVIKTAPNAFPGQQPIRVAIAGRSREKLEQILTALPTVGAGTNRVKVDIIVADAQDEASMKAMCRDSKTVIAAGTIHTLF